MARGPPSLFDVHFAHVSFHTCVVGGSGEKVSDGPDRRRRLLTRHRQCPRRGTPAPSFSRIARSRFSGVVSSLPNHIDGTFFSTVRKCRNAAGRSSLRASWCFAPPFSNPTSHHHRKQSPATHQSHIHIRGVSPAPPQTPRRRLPSSTPRGAKRGPRKL